MIKLLTVLGDLRTCLSDALKDDPEGDTAQHLTAYLASQNTTWEVYSSHFDHLCVDQENYPMLDGDFLGIWAVVNHAQVILHQRDQPPLVFLPKAPGETYHVAFAGLHY